MLLLSPHGGSLPPQRGFAPVAWGIMHYMGIVETGVVLIFIVAVALAVWWVVVRLRG
jgi:methionyl-tRNA formyltransferase